MVSDSLFADDGALVSSTGSSVQSQPLKHTNQ